MFQDRVNNPLTIGDRVAYSVSDRSTRLGVGHIQSFTTKRVRVQDERTGSVSDHQADRIVKVPHA